MNNSNDTQLNITKDVASNRCEALKQEHANNIMSSISILMEKNAYLVGITSKDDVVYLINNVITNWRAKTGPSDILVHVSLPTVYPWFYELCFNPPALEHLTDKLDDCYIPSLPGVASTEISPLVSVIKDGVDMSYNNKTTAPIDARSSYVIFNHTSLPPGVKDHYLAQ